jgi:Uma2 family endonuclease
MLRRATQYLEAGVPLVWLIDPEGQTTSVIQANEFPRLLEGNDGLGNDRHLPDLPLRVVDLFSFPQPVPE